MAESYVCAFRGRRDGYQVPLALAEASRLDQFITDFYAIPRIRQLAKFGPSYLRSKAEFRVEAGIPHERVRCLWGTTVYEHLRHRLGCARAITFMKLDRKYSQVAAQRAAQQRSDLLLYSPYAWEAFLTRYRHTPRRVLFQYHPHTEMESRLLAEDSVRFPGIGESFSHNRQRPLPESLVRRERDCWQHADLILCASAFTRRSLLEAGADGDKCCVVPYGIDVPDQAPQQPGEFAFHAVLVGSGSQRKGLHHLLHAWQNANLPKGSRLTLVCRKLDRGIEHLISETKQVSLLRGLSQAALNDLYSQCDLFVMPSLVEGFGQVYLEALAQGCPVLGTENTCLPDLGNESDGIFLVEPGNVEQLTAKLEDLSVCLPGNEAISAAARTCACRFSWSSFRQGICQALSSKTREHQPA